MIAHESKLEVLPDRIVPMMLLDLAKKENIPLHKCKECGIVYIESNMHTNPDKCVVCLGELSIFNHELYKARQRQYKRNAKLRKLTALVND